MTKDLEVRLRSGGWGGFGLLLVCMSVSGCGGPALVDTGQVAIVQPDALPAPGAADLVDGARPHLVGPGDSLAVDILGLPEMSRQVRVDAAGDIAVPLAGTVAVLGLNPEQVARAVEDRLRATYVRNPQVTVGIVDIVSQVVTVDGEVQRPGVYPVLGKSTLMRAIARAEGTGDMADTRHVVVFRTVNGQKMAALYDLQAIRRGAYGDPQIYSNDVVVVGESTALRLFPQIAQISSVILYPLVTILQ